MFPDIAEGIYETAIRNEVRKYVETHSFQWNDLAKECAVEMLEEIKFILDDAKSYEEMHKRIMEIVLFLNPPPYPKHKKRY